MRAISILLITGDDIGINSIIPLGARLIKYIKDSMYCTPEIESFYNNWVFFDEIDFRPHIRRNRIDIRNLERMDNKHAQIIRRRICESLSKRDRDIFIRLRLVFSIVNILYYDITLTKEYIRGFLMYEDHWHDLVRLIHISTKYDYLVDLIDSEIVSSCNSYLGRSWFSNNIVSKKINGESISFAIEKFSDMGIYNKEKEDDYRHNEIMKTDIMFEL